jgi:hypothetical protein
MKRLQIFLRAVKALSYATTNSGLTVVALRCRARLSHVVNYLRHEMHICSIEKEGR